jgi:hypothetical protein
MHKLCMVGNIAQFSFQDNWGKLWNDQTMGTLVFEVVFIHFKWDGGVPHLLSDVPQHVGTYLCHRMGLHKRDPLGVCTGNKFHSELDLAAEGM